MGRVHVLILRTAGTNCDLETQYAWERAGAQAERVHLDRLVERPGLLTECDVLTIPGGFSYGDDIAAGRILAARLERHLRDPLLTFIASGRLVLGICNGFQVLVKAGLLPEPVSRQPSAVSHQPGAPNRQPSVVGDNPELGTRNSELICTVTVNDPPGFQDRWVRLRANASPCVFLEPGRTYELPIAHGEGRVVFASRADLERIEWGRLNALLFESRQPEGGENSGLGTPDAEEASAVSRQPSAISGEVSVAAVNPNGSEGDIAGLCDASGRAFGLMPHPERFVDWTQHPCWTSQARRDPADGLTVFRNAVGYVG